MTLITAALGGLWSARGGVLGSCGTDPSLAIAQGIGGIDATALSGLDESESLRRGILGPTRSGER